ncbi:helix-turn-helix domain-containing protein [Caldivirga sp. UBA161]|uniref:helix-turn-helix domain-containing protein n=1 Tax=Caldivirga sp. UBA161 TaxID=1915569 RepID=UPI0025BA5A19|nr:helix-turn-helix domain-containing protein [Caldivirga sp. UBA161]
MPVEFVRFVIDHGDWAVFTGGSGVVVDVASSVPLINGVKRSMLIINAPSISDVKQLISRVRGFRGVKLIDVLGRYSVRGKAIALVSTVRDFRGGVLDVLLSNGVYYYREFIANGLEYWSIVASRAGVVLEELGGRGSVKVLNRVNVGELAELMGYLTLTRSELRILKEAYELGYFNWPRECSINDLANTLKVSKATLIQELRSALRRLIASELLKVKFT